MHSTRGVVEPQPSVCRCCITALIHAAQTAGSAGSNGASPTNRCHALKCRGATTVSTGTPRSSSASSSATKPPFSASSAPNRLQTTRSGCRSIASRRTWLARANPCGSALQAVDPAARDCDTMYSTPVSMSVNTVSVRHPAAGSRCAISRPSTFRPWRRCCATKAWSRASTSLRQSCSIAATGADLSYPGSWLIWLWRSGLSARPRRDHAGGRPIGSIHSLIALSCRKRAGETKPSTASDVIKKPATFACRKNSNALLCVAGHSVKPLSVASLRHSGVTFTGIVMPVVGGVVG